MNGPLSVFVTKKQIRVFQYNSSKPLYVIVWTEFRVDKIGFIVHYDKAFH